VAKFPADQFSAGVHGIGRNCLYLLDERDRSRMERSFPSCAGSDDRRTAWLERLAPLSGVVNEDHLHDLGKMLFAFSTLWMYIWFSQYMLIWYAHLPEETVYFAQRLHGNWQPLFILNLCLNWVVPFVVLMNRPAKRSRSVLAKVALVVLLGRWLDLYLMIMPLS